MVIELPLKPWNFPSEAIYRLNVWVTAHQLGLDIARLETYRAAIQAGFSTDEVN